MNSSVTPSILSGSLFSTSSSLLVPSSSKCARHTVAILGTGWFPLSFHKGKKLVVFGLAVLSIAWFCEFQDRLHGVFPFCFPCSLKVIRISLFLWAGLKVGHHCFKSFGQPTIEAVLFQHGHMVGREMARKESSQNLEVSP